MASRHEELDKSIDKSLDDFGRWIRRRWWLIPIVGVIAWYFIFYIAPTLGVPQPGTLLQLFLQIAFAVSFIMIQFIALFWFLGRPRIYWVMPGETGVGFDDYKGNPEVLDAARRIVILLRGVKNFKEMGGQVSRGVLLVDRQAPARAISRSASPPSRACPSPTPAPPASARCSSAWTC